MFDYGLEHVMSYSATLTTGEVIGPVPDGMRVNIYVTGGEATGPKFKGKILPVGGDWLTIRRDGVGVLDVRATFEAEGGGLIYCTCTGIIDLGETGYEDFASGKLPTSGTPIRMSPRYMTSHPDYLWMNRAHFVAIGAAFLERQEVRYDVYAVR